MTGSVDFAEIVAAIGDARQITYSEARELCLTWRAKYRAQVESTARAAGVHERDAAIVAHARDIHKHMTLDPRFSTGLGDREMAKLALDSARVFQAVVDEEFKS